METQQPEPCINRQRACKRISLATSFILFLLPVIVVADVCSYEKEVSYSLSSSDLEQLSIIAKAGSLSVHGAETGSDIVIEATLCSSRKSELEGMEVSHNRRGDVETLETVIPDFHGSLWISRYAYIDLEVSIPAGLAVTIKDGSGAMHVSGTGDLRIEDGSGEISVRSVAGNLTIRDGSGEINVEEVDGNVKINDGSGEMDVSDVIGNVDITDGSGHMRITQVGGTVSISDGSGGIDVRDVEQKVVIREDGSGSIDLRRVNSSVDIGSDDSSSLAVDKVRGNFTIRHKGSGETDYRNAEGDIFLP